MSVHNQLKRRLCVFVKPRNLGFYLNCELPDVCTLRLRKLGFKLIPYYIDNNFKKKEQEKEQFYEIQERLQKDDLQCLNVEKEELSLA